MGDADEEAAAAEAAPPRMDEDGNIIDSPKPIRRRPFSLRRMVGDVRRKCAGHTIDYQLIRTSEPLDAALAKFLSSRIAMLRS